MTPTARRILILLQNEALPHDRHVWNQSTALARAGYDVNVICPTLAGREDETFERIAGVAIHRYVPRHASDNPLSYMLEYLSALWNIRRLARRLAREGDFGVVHACSPPDFLLLAALGLRRRGSRFIFDHHDLTPELYLTRFGPGPLQRLTLAGEQVAFRSADVVQSVNDSYRRIALERGGRDPDDVFVVRTGPDLDRFVPSPPDPALKRGRPHLLAYAGVMGPQDGVDQALLALAQLKAKREDWHATFMGDGSELERMRALAAELGIGDHVEFMGWVEHATIGRVLSSADVCLAPDPKTPLNDISSMIKISEYMAMSRPIVSYDLAESRIGAGEAAVFAPPEDHAGFAELVSALLDDPERRAEMGRSGRRRAEGFLAWAHQERSLLAAYERAFAMGPVREGRLETLRRLLRPVRARRRGQARQQTDNPAAAGSE
jgi:glycosyltransferase involved in cell wall biosynthesis